MSASLPSNARPVVLVADDDQEVLDLVTFLLERAGFEVLAAVDGEHALELARGRSPDCAILDVRMPGIDGIEVMHHLRAADDTRTVPVILLSGRTREADIVYGLDEGADEYMTKPFSTLELLARVRALLRGREAREGKTEV